MAATTISNNSPAAGSIRWTAFTISYGGKAYPIAAGSSAARYVWWKYNTGAASGTGMPQLLTGDALPDLGPDDILLFLNKSGIGMLVPTTTILDGGLVVPDSIFAPSIAADQIGTKHLMVGAVEAEQIAAGAVTTNSLSVGSVSDNLVANGSFEDFADGALEGWVVAAQTGGSIAPVTGVASSGAVSVQFDASTGADLKLRQAAARYIPVSSASGRSWYFSVRAGASVATTRGAYLRVLWFDANRVQLAGALSSTDVVANRALTTTFEVLEGTATPPAAARFAAIEVIYASPNVASKLYVDEVVGYQVMVSARIADGAITTPKILVDEAFATKVFAGILQGAVIETNAADNRGVKIVDAGLLAYDNDGNETLRLDGANSILTGATIRTAAVGSRVQLSGPGGLEVWDVNEKKVLTAGAAGIEMDGTLRAKGSVNYQKEEMTLRVGLVLRENDGKRTTDTPGIAFEQPGVGGPTDNILAGGLFAMFSGDGVELLGPNLFGARQAKVRVSELDINIESGRSALTPEYGGKVHVGTWSYPATEEVNLNGVNINIGRETVRYNESVITEGSRTTIRGDLQIRDAPYGAAQTREQPLLSAGWTHVTSNGWNGVWIEQMGKWTVLNGTVQKGSFAWNEVISNLPAKYRPASKVAGMNCEIDPAGNLSPGSAGSGARSLSISYFAA